jgi:hypothetical protein
MENYDTQDQPARNPLEPQLSEDVEFREGFGIGGSTADTGVYTSSTTTVNVVIDGPDTERREAGEVPVSGKMTLAGPAYDDPLGPELPDSPQYTRFNDISDEELTVPTSAETTEDTLPRNMSSEDFLTPIKDYLNDREIGSDECAKNNYTL